MFRRNKVTWSSLEEDYLKENRDKQTIGQLAGYMGKSLNAIKKKLLEFDGKLVVKDKTNRKTKIGKRKDLDNLFVRSSWEANVLRWLKYQNIPYMYEPKTFIFPGIKHGTVSYTPDIFLPATNEWVEIKGFMDGHSRVSLNRFKKFFPEDFKRLSAIVGSEGNKAHKFCTKIELPIKAYMNELNKRYKKIIENWEQ